MSAAPTQRNEDGKDRSRSPASLTFAPRSLINACLIIAFRGAHKSHGGKDHMGSSSCFVDAGRQFPGFLASTLVM